MNRIPESEITGNWIVSYRGNKNKVDPRKPYGYLIEKERTAQGEVEDCSVIFLTNRECPFHCLMCDLWKNTTNQSIPSGAIPDQIEWALGQLPLTRHIKLYNSGSFFDERAIPSEDYKIIGSLVKDYKTVVVESHPRFIDERCLVFRDMIKTELQVAIGLEIANPEILKKLNKHMTIEDFSKSVSFLKRNGIPARAFILLRPPFINEKVGIYWAKRSIDFAFGSGVECCVVIPVRAGNGAMDKLKKDGFFSEPDVRSLEEVLEYGIGLKAGRVFADTWDLKLFSKCDKCLHDRINRLTLMNHSQEYVYPIKCTCDT